MSDIVGRTTRKEGSYSTAPTAWRRLLSTRPSVWLSTGLAPLKPFGVDGDLVRCQAVVVCDFPKLLVAAPQREAMTVGVTHDEVSHAIRTGGDGLNNLGSGS